MNYLNFNMVKVDGLDIFYREAGDKSKPTILLLHGFPSSSHMFRDLINDLSADYHLIAPDYPGFGQSSSPAVTDYDYSFDNLALTRPRYTGKRSGLVKRILFKAKTSRPKRK
jgi:pimeloyl-ACP methyl ester carboxylesterase